MFRETSSSTGTSRSGKWGSDLQELPDLGVGIVYLPGLEHVLEARSTSIDVIEVEPQPFTSFVDGKYELREDSVSLLNGFPQPKLVHGVGAPVGGTVTNDSLLEPFVDAISVLGAQWASEHLTFNRVSQDDSTFFTGFMLPPSQTMESVELAVDNIRRIQNRIDVPFSFEIPVNYLRPRAGEMSDGLFFAEVAAGADCGILLDLHNVWCNERNGRQPIESLIEELPLDRVNEIHLADGRQLDGYWVDAHSGLISEDLFGIARTVVPRIPDLKAIVFEIMPEYMNAAGITVEDVIHQAERMQQVWDLRGSATCGGQLPSWVKPLSPEFSTSQWEETLGGLVTDQEIGDDSLKEQLMRDPGTFVYRKMAESVRSGMIASALTLTFRLLMLEEGEEGVQELLHRYWATRPPQPSVIEEARGFAEWLVHGGTELPHADEIASFEIASVDVASSGQQRLVTFSCDPMTLLTALGEGRLPEALPEGSYELTIEPETIAP